MNNLDQDTKTDFQPIDKLSLDSNLSNDKPSHRIWQKPITYLGCMLVGAGIAVLTMRYQPNHSWLSQPLGSNQPVNATRSLVNPSAPDSLNFITSVVNQTGPAVVRIDSTQTITNDKL